MVVNFKGIDESGYTYLAIVETDEIKEKEIKEKFKALTKIKAFLEIQTTWKK